MSEVKRSDWFITIALTQVAALALKIFQIGAAARLSWLQVFMPVWVPTVFAAALVAFFWLTRVLLPEKKKQVLYTSTRWQERLAESHTQR